MQNTDKTILASNLIRFRKQLGLTQLAISTAVGIERSRYAHYEKDTTPSAPVLRRLATVLNVTTDELLYAPEQNLRFRENDNIETYDSFLFSELRNEEKELIMRFRLLNSESKSAIRRAIYSELEKNEQ